MYELIIYLNKILQKEVSYSKTLDQVKYVLQLNMYSYKDMCSSKTHPQVIHVLL